MGLVAFGNKICVARAPTRETSSAGTHAKEKQPRLECVCKQAKQLSGCIALHRRKGHCRSHQRNRRQPSNLQPGYVCLYVRKEISQSGDYSICTDALCQRRLKLASAASCGLLRVTRLSQCDLALARDNSS